jgi:hypothetical protein
MARYTCFFTLAIPIADLHQAIQQVLESCNLKVLYNKDEYMMARENPGGVAFPKLVTVEVLIDRTKATDHAVSMKCVVKNEELPLQTDNHCHQMFDTINTAMTASAQWKLIETVVTG